MHRIDKHITYLHVNLHGGEVLYLLFGAGQPCLHLCITRSVSTTVQREGYQARRADIEQALGRVLMGSCFRSSAQCQALLRYIVEHSLAHEDEMLRERVIGIEVFGRPPDYDSGNDPIVRARAAEIRKRLAQHYLGSEGASEEIRIEVPSGSYRAVFALPNSTDGTDTRHGSGSAGGPTVSPANQANELRAPSGAADKPNNDSANLNVVRTDLEEPRSTQTGHKRSLLTVILVGVAMGMIGALIGHWSKVPAASHQDVQGSEISSAASGDPVEAFWAPFLKEDRSPIIAYADAMFLIDGEGDLFRFRHGASDNRGVLVDTHLAHQFASNPTLVASAGPLFYDNGYTGTGDLRAMAMLISQLAHMGATPIVESSYDISADDLKLHNVILLGSSAEDLAVAQLVPTGDFLFEGHFSNHDPWSDQIVDTQPRPGEQSKYGTIRDPASHVLKEDYALVSFQPGIASDHQLVILGGIDTTGTEGAALLVTSKSGVEELLKALPQARSIPEAAGSRAFQALVRVDVKKGYQVLGSHLVSVHSLTPRTGTTTSSSAP